MRSGAFILAVISLVEILLAILAYLLLVEPMRFFRWCVVERWKAWGVQSILVDETRFRRIAKGYGLFVALIAIFIATVVLKACTIARWLRT